MLFDEDLLGTVDENIVHVIVFQKRFKRAKAGDFVEQILAKRRAIFAV